MARNIRCTTEDIEFCDFIIPKGSAFPNQGKPAKHPTNSRMPQTITLADHLNCVMQDPQGEPVFPYPYNRKDGSFNNGTVKAWREGISKDGLGHISVGIYQGKLTLAGYHSRTRGFLEAFFLGNLSESDLKSHISVVFCDNYLNAYKHEGDKNVSHTAAMQAVNPDFVFGSCCNILESRLGDAVKKRMRVAKLSTALNCIMLAFHEENEGNETNWDDWASIYQMRGKTNKMSQQFAGYLNITEEQYQLMEDSVNFWFEMICELEKQAQDLKKLKDTYKQVAQIVKSGGFFGYIATDRIGKRNMLRMNHAISVRNILNNLTESSEISTSLMREKHFNVRNVVVRMDKIMREKPKAVAADD